MGYARAREDQKRDKKNMNQARKLRVEPELTPNQPRKKEWKAVGRIMAKYAKAHGIPTKRKGGMWHIPREDYQFVWAFYDLEE